MIISGLVSVTFRELSPAEIILLARRAGLAALEWGGDVHVPPGDPILAAAVARQTVDAGLRVLSYGSYYHVGHAAQEPYPFDAVLATALALGAPNIRVWAGQLESQVASEAYRQQVIADARRIGALAAQAGLTVSFEFHGGSLTDTAASARRLLEEVAHPAVKSYWQPPQGSAHPDNLAGLAAVQPWLTHLHVFHWQVSGTPPVRDRRPLAEGAAVWPELLRQAAQDGREHGALLEFVRADSPEQFLQDAAALTAWLSQPQPHP